MVETLREVAFTVAGSFIEVTVWVGAMIGGFAYLQYRLGDRVSGFLTRNWRRGPLIGALAGVIPGCGGAILVVPLFVRSRVSFGTLVAALVATMGDSSFVLIAADPNLALVVHAMLFASGVAFGAAVDVVGYSPRRREHPDLPCGCPDPVLVRERVRHADATVAANVRPGCPGRSDGSTCASPTPLEGDGPHPALGARVGRLVRSLGPATTGFWALVLLGMTITLPVAAQRFEPEEVPRVIVGVDPFLAVGGIGFLLAYLVARRSRQERQGLRARPTLRGTAAVLREAAQESSRVAVWIAVAFVAIELATELGLSITGVLSVVGLAGVVVGALLGLIPGCAPQIVLTGLYLGGTVPFSTLAANALSQDGDALLPLLLLDRRSAVIVSVLTTLPGVLVGTAILLTGWAP